jgi:hypothetical protein
MDKAVESELEYLKCQDNINLIKCQKFKEQFIIREQAMIRFKTEDKDSKKYESLSEEQKSLIIFDYYTHVLNKRSPCSNYKNSSSDIIESSKYFYSKYPFMYNIMSKYNIEKQAQRYSPKSSLYQSSIDFVKCILN